MSSLTASSILTDNQSQNGSTADALKRGSLSTVDGGMSFRAAYREGNEAGMRRGVAAFFNSPVMEQLTLELKLSRVAIQAMSGVAAQRERELASWKAEAQWWREEHDRVSAEYTAFVKAMAAKCAK